MGNSY